MEEIEFFYRKFYYTKDTLAPRLETESLVREAIKIAKNISIDTLIDVGTGTSIIGVSIEKNSEIPKIFGIEKSKKAMKIAKINIDRHDSKMKLVNSDLLKAFFDAKEEYDLGDNVMIVTNLPYIKDEDWANMSSDTRFEPKMALFGGKKTGFELYKKFFSQILPFKETFMIKELHVVAEMGYDQKQEAEEYLRNLGFDPRFFADLRGIERFVYFNLK